jgi:hypothetical protein
MTTDVTTYTNLITSEHADAPKFNAVVATVCQPLADLNNLADSYSTLFDLDTAIGDQLDKVGDRVGVNRFLEVPVTDVYFSWDTDDLGWDQGYWQGPFDPDFGKVELPDDQFRLLLRAKIAANFWDGTIPGAYAAWDLLFQGTFQLLIQDYGDMSMDMGVIVQPGWVWDPITLALLLSGELDLRPAGVRINQYFQGSLPGQQVFAWDVDPPTDSEAGWDTGVWAIPLSA